MQEGGQGGIVSCLKLNESKLARSVHGHLCIYREGSAMQEGGQGGIVSCLKLNESKLARSVHGHLCIYREGSAMQEGGQGGICCRSCHRNTIPSS